MNIRNNIPNAITCLNLLFGLLAVVLCLSNEACSAFSLSWPQARWAVFALIALAALADFADGLVARALGATSDIGKELDSLCDLVSFGLAPAALVIRTGLHTHPNALWPLMGLLIAIAGALRLARFNVDTNQATTFTGLPIPANALFWVGYAAWITEHPNLPQWATITLVILLSWLMISPIRMFSLKLHSLAPATAWPQYTLIGVTVVMLPLIGLPTLCLTVALYLLLSLCHREQHEQA